MRKVYIQQPTSSLGLFTLAALMDCDEECSVYFSASGDDQLIAKVKKVNPCAIPYSGNLDGINTILVEGDSALNTSTFTLLIQQGAAEQVSSHQEPYCVLQVPCFYQQLAYLQNITDEIEAVDAEDVALIAATILSSHTQPHLGKVYQLPGHRISPDFLAAIKHRLPAINQELTTKDCLMINENDWHKIIPGHETCTIEEYLQKCETSLYHQRFL